MKKIFVRSAYNYDVDLVSDETGLMCMDESLAHQSFAEECDINTIVRRFGITGEMPEGLTAPVYADYDGVFDFQSALNSVAHAREAFDAMPAEVRYRFNNDPQRLLEFVAQVENRAEAEKIGLVVPKAVSVAPAPIRVEVVAPAAPDAPKA